MASVIREIIIDAPRDKVWDVVGDFAKGPLRFAPGMLVDCRVEEPGV